jgi:hypothetical protein
MEAAQEAEVAAANTFSFDVEQFREHMEGSDELTVIIRAHLYLEHILIQTLIDAFVQPHFSDISRIGFPARLSLCIALGLLAPEWRDPILRVNNMRNNVAHKLDATISNDRKAEFWALLPAFLQEALRETKTEIKTEDDITIGYMLTGLVLYTDISRQQRKTIRIKEEFSTRYLRKVLDELPSWARRPAQGKSGDVTA